MINNDKWINSLPNSKLKQNQETLQIDHNKWIDQDKYAQYLVIFHLCVKMFLLLQYNF